MAGGSITSCGLFYLLCLSDMIASWTRLAHEYLVLCKSTLFICRKPWRRTWPWNNQLPYPLLHQSPGQLTQFLSIFTTTSSGWKRQEHQNCGQHHHRAEWPHQQTLSCQTSHTRGQDHTNGDTSPWKAASASWPDIPHYWDFEPNTC